MVAPSQHKFWPAPLHVLWELCPSETAGPRGLPRETDTLSMLSASRRTLQLLSSSIPVRMMGDSSSKVISAEEALPGRTESIPVAGTTAWLLSMRVEPAHSALPEKVWGCGWVPGCGLRVREEAAPPPSPAPQPGRGLSSAGQSPSCVLLFV